MFSAMSEFCCSTIIICWQFVSDVFHIKLLKLIWRIWVNLHRIKCFWIERIMNMCSVQKGFCTETRNIKVNNASASIFWCKLACDRIIFLSDILPCIFLLAVVYASILLPNAAAVVLYHVLWCDPIGQQCLLCWSCD